MQSLIGWFTSHWALVLLAVKSVLDLLFAINPKLDAPGGVVDAVYQWLKGKTPPSA